jgi:hypothetical protein
LPSDVVVGKPVTAANQNAQNDALDNLNSRLAGVENEILANGSFENDLDADGEPDNWTITDYIDGSHAIDGTTRGDGLNSLKCAITVGGGYVEATNGTFVPIYPGARIEAGFIYKSTVATARIRVQLLWFDSAQAPTSTSTVFDSATGNPSAWTVGHGPDIQAVCPSGSYFYKVKLIAGESGNVVAADVSFDSIRSRIFHGRVVVSRISKTAGTVDISGDVVAGEKAVQAEFGIEMTSGSGPLTPSVMGSGGNGKTGMNFATGNDPDDALTPRTLVWILELNSAQQCTITVVPGAGSTPGTYTLWLLSYYV